MQKKRSILAIILIMAFSAFLAVSALNRPTLRKVRTSVTNGLARSKLEKRNAMPNLRRLGSSSSSATLYGIVNNGSSIGYYSFNASAIPDFQLLFTHENLNPTGSAVYVDGKLYVNCWTSGVGIITAKQYVYDVATGMLDKTNDILVTSCATAMTYDKTTDRVYGQFYDEDMMNFYWGVQDLGDGSVFLIDQMDDLERVYALAASPSGEIYGIDKHGKLVKINKETGHFSETIGETGIVPDYIQSATFGADGNLYWAASTSNGYNALYKLDTSTAQATMVTQYADGRQIIALTPGTLAPDAKAPKKVDNLNIDFPNGALSGKVSYTIPSATEDGTLLTKDLTAYLDVDMKTYTATGKPGETVSFNVAASNADELKFSAYTEVDGVKSDRQNEYRWIGTDRPVLPSNPVLTVNGDQAALTWEKPVGMHGGYVNADAVTYDIIRYPEARYAKQAYNGTTYTETIDKTKSRKLSYAVVPTFGEKTGKPGYSNEYSIDVIAEVPVSYNLSIVKSDWNYFTVIDANNDGYTWKWNNRAEIEGNDEEANDDWLITPAIHLKADRLYYLSYTYWLQNGIFYPQTYEIKAGTGTTVADMTTEVLGKTVLNKGFASEGDDKCNLVVPTEGNYNIGFHNVSDQGGTMRLLSIEVTEGLMLSSPKAPEDLTVTPGEDGELSATVSLKAPLTDASGAALKGLSKLEVLRSGSDGKFSVVKTFTSPAIGEELSFEDTGMGNGTVTYKAVAYDSNGLAGLYSEEVSAYCGQDVPSAPTNAKITVTDSYKAHVTWDAPAKGKNGHYINPDELTYTVYEADDYVYGWDAAAEDISEKECDVEYEPEGNEQIDCTYLIIPSSVAGSGDYAVTKTVVFGPSYTLPYSEDFDGGFVKSFFRKGKQTWDDEEGGWTTSDTEGYGNSDGCAYYRGYESNSQSLISGKIDVRSAENPVLTFRIKSTDGNDGKLVVKIADDYSGTYSPVKTIKCKDCDGEWKLVQVPLSAYKNKPYIHIAFDAYSGDGDAKILIDNILVRSLPKHDLAIFGSPTASTQFVKIGESSSVVSVNVENVGAEAVGGSEYTVDFYNGNTKIGSVKGKDIESNAKETFEFTFTPSVEDAGTVAVKAKANYDADEDKSNNESESVNIKVGKPSLPDATNLKADKSGNAVNLSWTAPDVNVDGMRVTDGFEDYEPFAVSGFGDWTTRDVDGQPTCTVGDFEFDHMGEPKAFQVFNPSMTSPKLTVNEWQPYSGDQMLVCFSTETPTNDDWLISPLLSGKKQNISFMAKTADATWGKEKIEIWYSTTGTDAADFVQLTEKPYEVPTSWTEYVYTLPEGTKYFAIRCVSSVTFALFIDDVSFEKKLAEGLTVEGYNIYRNGERVNQPPVVATTFSDSEGKDGDKYYVTTVFNMGESAGSNVVTVGTSGINGINASESNSGKVYEINGQRAFKTKANHIYIINGKKVVVNTNN